MRSISNRNSGASNVFNLANGERAPCFLLTPSTFKVFWPTSRMLILALNLKMMISGCGSSNPKVDFGCGPLLSKFGGCVVGFLGVSYDGCFVYRLNWHCDPLGALVSDWAATHMCVANCVLIHGCLESVAVLQPLSWTAARRTNLRSRRFAGKGLGLLNLPVSYTSRQSSRSLQLS